MSRGSPAAGGDPAAITLSVTVPYRARFDECGPDGRVRTSTLLRYAQDAAWVHAEQLGLNRAWARAHGLTWLVRAAEVAVLRPIVPGMTLDVTTRLGGVRKVLARRRTEVHDEDGALAAVGATDWLVVDGRGVPSRLPPDFLARFDIVPGVFDPIRVALPPANASAFSTDVVVRRQDLDPLGHVNNATYLDYLEESLGPAGQLATAAVPRRIRVEYLQPAIQGAALCAASWPLASGSMLGWAWRMTDQAGRELARGIVDEPPPGD